MQTTNEFIKPKRNYKSSVSYCDPVLLSRENLHRTYSGNITEWDYQPVYSENHTIVGAADKIISDFRFDNFCNSQSENTKRKIEYKKENTIGA